jgi:hypothetical protein
MGFYSSLLTRIEAVRRYCVLHYYRLTDIIVVTIKRRQELFLDAFTSRRAKGGAISQTPFAIFVKKLQESLTRMESFDVVTVAQGVDGQFSSTSLARFCAQYHHRFQT